MTTMIKSDLSNITVYCSRRREKKNEIVNEDEKREKKA
jgi:hypothetical protein